MLSGESMQLRDLIGREIQDILFTEETYDKSEYIALMTADCYMVLDEGLVIGFPLSISGDTVWIRELDPSARSYFPPMKKMWWQRRGQVSAASDIKGRRITSIVGYTSEDVGEDEPDRTFFELDSGVLITHVPMRPVGIHVGLYVHASIREVEVQYGKDWIRISG